MRKYTNKLHVEKQLFIKFKKSEELSVKFYPTQDICGLSDKMYYENRQAKVERMKCSHW